MCMYVCMYVYVYVCVYIYIYLHTRCDVVQKGGMTSLETIIEFELLNSRLSSCFGVIEHIHTMFYRAIRADAISVNSITSPPPSCAPWPYNSQRVYHETQGFDPLNII